MDSSAAGEVSAGAVGAAKALFRVLRRALAELQVVFAGGGECDFTELTLLAKHALDAGRRERD